MRSAKSHLANTENRWIPGNPILRTFRMRILQFLPEGLNKIWFRLFEDEEFELAGALCFIVEDNSNILKFGGFSIVHFKIRVDLLQRMIGVDIDVDIQYNHDAADGKKTNEYWIRFKNDFFASYAHKLKLTADEERTTPYDCKRDQYIADFIYSMATMKHLSVLILV